MVSEVSCCGAILVEIDDTITGVGGKSLEEKTLL